MDIKAPKVPDKINLVLAPNYRHYKYWFEHVLEEPGNYIYINSFEKLMGYSADRAQILLLDDWWNGYSGHMRSLINREIDILQAAGMGVHNVSST